MKGWRGRLSALALELGFTVPTVNTIMKDAAHIKEHMKGNKDVKVIFHLMHVLVLQCITSIYVVAERTTYASWELSVGKTMLIHIQSPK
jgi:hypothetical protein